MDRQKLSRYKPNKRELEMIGRQLERLNERLEAVPEISGKVTKSSDDFPYIEQHVTVRMQEPKEATEIKDKIREKKKRQQRLMRECEEVEAFIAAMPEGVEKQIFEAVYLEGMNQTKVAEVVGYTQSMISKIIKSELKDS